jgi:predicted nucleic acid-binding protein
MKLYLDLCALKRPFDHQTQDRIIAETQAVLSILDRIESGIDSMVWSTALTLENDADPDLEARKEVARYAVRAVAIEMLSPKIEKRIREFAAAGLAALDAAHLAFAESAGCDVLVTCDDRFLRGSKRTDCSIRVLRPEEYGCENDSE